MLAILNETKIELFPENDSEKTTIKELLNQHGHILHVNISDFVNSGKLIIEPKTILNTVSELGSEVKEIGTDVFSKLANFFDTTKK